jgi:hypothetical protein
MNERDKARFKQRYARPEVKAAQKEYERRRRENPEIRAKIAAQTKAYRERPEIKARLSARRKERNLLPWVMEAKKARDKEYRNRKEIKDRRKARLKERMQSADVKARISAYMKSYSARPDVRKARYEYTKKRRRNDPNFKIALALRGRVCVAMASKTKRGSAIKDLGCSVNDFRMYIESKFAPGMTWENYGYRGWHFDHIRPLSSFDLTDIDQFKMAVHFSNLQPLWAAENFAKHNKLETGE